MFFGRARRTRAWLWVIGGALVTVALAGALFWFAFVPNWRPPLRAGERYGVDVSAHQGEIDWPRVAADEIRFAYIKASEGGSWTDSRFRANWAAAGAAGPDPGAYHFFTLCGSGDEQARHFLAVAPPDPRALRPAVDLELSGNCGRRPPASTVDAELEAFLNLVGEAVGGPAVSRV